MDLELAQEVLDGKFESSGEVNTFGTMKYDLSEVAVENHDLIYNVNQTAADTYTSVETPGFGAAIAALALVSAGLLALINDYEEPLEEEDNYEEDEQY